MTFASLRVPLAVGTLLVVALTIRLTAIDPEPSCPTLTREAIFARAIFLRGDAGAPAWRRDVAADQSARSTHAAPPVIETIAALAYRLAGHESLWIARALSAVYWTAGGLFLFLAAARLAPTSGAFAATLVFLFLPWSLPQSRSIDPGPLAVLCLCAGLWAILRHDAEPTRARLGVSAIATAAAVFVRFMTGFFLLPVFGALLVRRLGWRRGLRHPHAWSFVLSSALPAGLYYARAVWSDPAIRHRAGADLVPGLFAQAGFWADWWRMIGATLTWPLFLCALLGVVVLVVSARRSTASVAMAASWTGYAAYGCVFDFHMATHAYYQTLALPMIALSIAPVRAVRGLAIAAAAVMALMAAASWRTAWAEPDVRADVAEYRAAGALAAHSTRAVYLSACWGTPLEYYGEVSGLPWPSRFEIEMYRPLGDAGIPDVTADARLAQLSAALGGAEYFIGTDPDELSRQPDLAHYLDDRFALVSRSPRHVVYDLRRPAGGGRE